MSLTSNSNGFCELSERFSVIISDILRLTSDFGQFDELWKPFLIIASNSVIIYNNRMSFISDFHQFHELFK